MKSMQTLTVELDARSYPIHVGSGLLARAGELLAPVLPSKRVVVIADSHVAPLYASALIASLKNTGFAVELIEIPAGEYSKNFHQLEQLLEKLLMMKCDRKTALVALGGGVVGDLVGFTASILLRGVPFVQVPTSLLAQVDSSVGGKTAVNARVGKNLIGSFYQPQLVLADLDTLGSLPRRELLAGYAEVIKYGLIMNADFYGWCLEHAEALLQGDTGAQQHAVLESCRMKAQVVAADEREANDQRALLNFGHTFGHALEAELQYDGRLLHGEAVAVGMLMGCRLSQKLGLTDDSLEKQLRQHFLSIGMPTSPTDVESFAWDANNVAEHFAGDKKTESGKLNFVVLEALGNARVQKNVDPSLALAVVNEFLKTA